MNAIDRQRLIELPRLFSHLTLLRSDFSGINRYLIKPNNVVKYPTLKIQIVLVQLPCKAELTAYADCLRVLMRMFRQYCQSNQLNNDKHIDKCQSAATWYLFMTFLHQFCLCDIAVLMTRCCKLLI